jgi:hypothetical protein
MPYIKEYDRMYILETTIGSYTPHTVGDLNFAISTILSSYIKLNGLSYSNINNLIGVLECAKLELYRRVASPYEDEKIIENGDVY